MNVVANILSAHIDNDLVNRLLNHYTELKTKFYQGRYEPSEINCGKFAEIIWRILEFLNSGTFTPFNRQVTLDSIITSLVNNTSLDDSLRIHIPRTLRSVYDVRNRRGVAHVGNISANMMDSMFGISCCDWILAEFVRLYHNLSPDEAQRIVDTIVQRKAPMIEEIGSGLLVLDPNFSLLEEIILILYHKSSNYVEYSNLQQWIPDTTLECVRNGAKFLFDFRLVHTIVNGAKITRTGIQFIEVDFPRDICLLSTDFKSYALSKGVSNHDDIALAAACWRLEKYNENTLNSETLSQMYPVGRYTIPRNLRQHLSWNVQLGYLERVSTGIFRPTETGLLHMRKKHILCT